MAYTYRIDERDEAALLHCEVQRWSARVCQDIQFQLAAIAEVYGDKPLFATYVDAKQGKFLKLMGFVPTNIMAPTLDGGQVQLWRYTSGN